MAKAIQTVCVCVCVCEHVCLYFVCLCDCICDQLAAKSYTGSADRADRRQSGFDQSRLPWWLGIRPITSDVIGATCAKTMQWQSKDNAKVVFLHLIVWFHQEWIGRSNVFSHRRRHWPRIFQLVECMWKTADITKTPNTSPHQCLTRLTSFSSWIAKKQTTNIAISSGNKSCELAGWNDFLIDIHLIHGSVQRL